MKISDSLKKLIKKIGELKSRFIESYARTKGIEEAAIEINMVQETVSRHIARSMSDKLKADILRLHGIRAHTKKYRIRKKLGKRIHLLLEEYLGGQEIAK